MDRPSAPSRRLCQSMNLGRIVREQVEEQDDGGERGDEEPPPHTSIATSSTPQDVPPPHHKRMRSVSFSDSSSFHRVHSRNNNIGTDMTTTWTTSIVRTSPLTTPQHFYDPTFTMIRLRTSMVGDPNPTNHVFRHSPDFDPITTTTTMSKDDGYHTTMDAVPTASRSTFTSTSTSNPNTTQRWYLNGGSGGWSQPDTTTNTTTTTICTFTQVASQIPAIVLITIFHLMIGIPFGVSYFPIGWDTSSHISTTDYHMDSDGIQGTFPLSDKEALGIRMFLFSTIIGQLIFTVQSGFDSPIGLQMVENVPFCHALSRIVIHHQGYGVDALSTILVLFGLSSIMVGIVFYILGKLKLGRIIYYFPNHVLVGCIGGIGIFIAKTGCEVTTNAVISWQSIIGNVHQLIPLLFFEMLLRLLQRILVDRDGKAIFPLLAPIYFCMITPMFYLILWICRVDMQYANEAGFFFPSLLDTTSSQSSMFGSQLLDMWSVIDFKSISWPAVWDAVPTMIALTLFSLIHVPINIPAFAVSTDTVADMNKELIAHGYSNILSGLCGGLQNYFAYTQSVLYHRSGGHGKSSGMAVAACTTGLFVFGPLMTSYIPRCMAGTLLLHVGIDLFLEGVYDSIGKFDYVEYAGIWLITIVMTTLGMEAAMIAGGIAAVSTHAVQSVHYVNPIRGSMTASTLRSSRWNRTNEELKILDDESVGRNRILVIQLQGHLFFGNMAQFMEKINRLFTEKAAIGSVPWIVLLDFSLVLGIDSSAAQTMTKLSNNLRISFGADLCIFVTGSDAGFPCEFNLSKELLSGKNGIGATTPNESTALLQQSNGTVDKENMYSGNHIEQSLDLALAFAEDCLLHRQGMSRSIQQAPHIPSSEMELALHQIANISPAGVRTETIKLLLSFFHRESYDYDEVIWNQGAPSDCLKLLVEGRLLALLENEAGTKELVHAGNMVGELGLIQGLPRMSSLKCLSENCVVYNLSRSSFDLLCQSAPDAARLLDLICIRYLSNRVQHVSNRIFETRCLPI